MVQIKIERKQKFLVNTVILGILMYLFIFNKILFTPVTAGLALIYLIVSIYIVHYPNLTLKTLPISVILPLSLTVGSFYVLRYFPNLTFLFKIGLILGYSALYYVMSLVDNIFLVVNDRQELIPLYRVAVTWSHILLVVVAIPFYAGIYKLPINSLIQNLIIFFASCVFCFYVIWAGRYDKGLKNIKVGEGILLVLFSSFIVLGMTTAVSFIPSEAFMRALLISSTLMFVLNYSVTGYLKNEIHKKIIFEYISIVILFFILTLIFD